MIPTYCFLRIPNLPALLSQRKLPVCPHRPLAVVTDTGERGVVRSASPEALALGVRPGLLVRQLRRFNGTLDLIPEQPEERLSIVRELTAMLKGYTPAVQAKGEDCFLLDLTGTGRLWGSPARVGRELLDRLTLEWRLAASIGIGPTRTLARIASAVTSAPGLREVTGPKRSNFCGRFPWTICRAWGPRRVTDSIAMGGARWENSPRYRRNCWSKPLAVIGACSWPAWRGAKTWEVSRCARKSAPFTGRCPCPKTRSTRIPWKPSLAASAAGWRSI
jgi:nucleotidyltransferase/DNA polymerase involved in DNA repair